MGVDVTVIFVSDYKAGDEKSWEDMRKALRALAKQDFTGTFEVLLIEEERFIELIPSDLLSILPQLRVLTASETNSYTLANRGVSEADSEFVILLDADCVPESQWMSSCVRALQADKTIGVVSGKTRYPGRTLTERCLALLSRSYVDPGQRGPTRHISNNNAGFRRKAFVEHPLPANSGVYASRLQAVSLEQDHWRMIFEPNMVVEHDFEGWSMERDIRRHMAHNLVSIRRKDPSLPYAWVVRMGPLSLPLYVAGRLLQQWRKCLTAYSGFDVRPWQLPYAMVLAVGTSLLEIPGALRALRGQSVGDTAYR